MIRLYLAAACMLAGAGAGLAQPDWENPHVLGRNKEPPADFIAANPDPRPNERVCVTGTTSFGALKMRWKCVGGGW